MGASSTETTSEELSRPTSKLRWRKPAWRLGVAVTSAGVLFALLINVSTVIGVARRFGSYQKSVATLYTGSCDRVNTMSVCIHLAINALSTLLLSGSNYCMQCLSAPTRENIDEAHSRQRWMDIGVPSIRNLRRIGTKRVVLWWSLALSSIPLHLFYNSTFFSAITVNEYEAAIVSESFIEGGPIIEPESLESCRAEIDLWRERQIVNGLEPDENRSDLIFLDIDDSFELKKLQASARTFDNLTKDECIHTYANDFITDRGNLILVADVQNLPLIESSNNSLLDLFTYGFVGYSIRNYRPYDWICDVRNDETCAQRLEPLLKNVSNGAPWTIRRVWGTFDYRKALGNGTMSPDGFDVKYCLSERLPEACSLHFSYSLMFVVIAFNVVKFVTMGVVIFSLGQMNPLVTVGDAVDSFVTRNDAFTRGMCLVGRTGFSSTHVGQPDWSASPKQFNLQRRRWGTAASGSRWIAVLFFFGLAIIVSLILLQMGISSLNSGHDHASSLWTLGFGTLHVGTLVTGTNWNKHVAGSLVSLTLIANLPQTILSFLYLFFNGLCTSMVLAVEWAGYQHERKPLRVSDPRGRHQRSTYFLQLPYRFAVPLLVVSGLLHWLVSQSLFLANVAVMSHRRRGRVVDHAGLLTLGFSPVAIIFTLVLGVVMLSVGVAFGLTRSRRRSGMPVAGSCSAAIAAACQYQGSVGRGRDVGDEGAPPPHSEDATDLPLQWGAVQDGWGHEAEAEAEAGPDWIGHCCFSSRPVTAPIEGKKYA